MAGHRSVELMFNYDGFVSLYRPLARPAADPHRSVLGELSKLLDQLGDGYCMPVKRGDGHCTTVKCLPKTCRKVGL